MGDIIPSYSHIFKIIQNKKLYNINIIMLLILLHFIKELITIIFLDSCFKLLNF